MHKRVMAILLCVGCTLTNACQKARVETSSAVAPAAAPALSNESISEAVQPPTDDELRKVIKRNYQDVVTVDNNRSTPFLLGDFNGDHSQDIAIVVKPGRGKLPDLNSEYVNWILEDPHKVGSHEQQTAVTRPSPTVVRLNDVLLAVIHGHEGAGWRNALATQTYLLKNAVGVEYETQSVSQLNTTGEGQSLPSLRGDVIRQKLEGIPGIIYWTGAKYAWHPMS